MRRFAVVLLVLSCLFAMVGCSQVPPEEAEENFTERPVTVVNEHYDVEVIFIQVGGLFSYLDYPDKFHLNINWYNRTEQNLQCSKIVYWIERLDNGQWISCAVKDNTFTASDYELRPYGSVKSYEITDRFDMSASGTYRFMVNCDIIVGDKAYTDVTLWTEFMIE